MATNDERMSDTPDFEAQGEARTDVSGQTLEDGQTLDNTQPIEEVQVLAETQPIEDAPALADTQSLAAVSAEQSDLIDADAEALASLKKLEEQRKGERKKRRIAIVVACVVVLALIGVFAGSQMAANSSKTESTAATAAVKRAELTSSVQTTGIVVPVSTVNVSAEVSGVMTNENAQALHEDGTPIEGLYCVGNLGGPFYGGSDYPFHQTGLSLGRCYTFGMIAAKHALGKL